MSLIVTVEKELQRIAPPNLPLAPGQYDSRYQEQYSNILRLYFNRLNDIVSQLTTNGGVIPPVTNYLVASLPSASTSGTGARAFVTNALAPVFGATVAGGGAVAVPVYSDGTNWKVG
jgi:hypothetical protein